MYAGNTIDVSVDEIIRVFDLTDETTAVVIDLTHEDLALFPDSVVSGESGAAASNKDNSNNNKNSYGAMVEESALSVPPKLESRLDVVEGVVYTGTLTKQVKASLFRRYRQDRICALLKESFDGVKIIHQ